MRKMRYIIISLLLFALLVSNCPAQNMDSIKVQLESDSYISLKHRQQVMPTIKKFGYESPQMDSLNKVISNSDSIALQRVVSIIKQYGWLGKSKIGPTANNALFLAIQHTDNNSIRELYYPLLERSALSGESELSAMATMKDRILIQNGLQQLYGTQSDVSGNLFPVQDPDNLNSRRRRVGLSKLKMK
jgi:hypothetical protein